MNILFNALDAISAKLGCEMMCSDLTLKMALIVFGMVLLGSFMDSIAGGGGIITVPAYLLAGLPAHIALGTNKMSAGIGSFASVLRYIKNGYVVWKLVLPSAVFAIIGSYCGTRLQLMLPEKYVQYMLLIVLPVVAFVVLRQRSLPEECGEMEYKKRLLISCTSALVIGAYDGFYGPGTGTFLLLIFCKFAKLDVRTANGNTKVINFSSNIGSLFTSLINGKVFLLLGLIGAVASVTGNIIGSGLAIKGGSKIVRPTVIIVLVLLAIKIISGLL